MASADDDTPRTSLPANDAWTGMLAISLLALIAGCVLLFLDWRNHQEKPTKLQSVMPPMTAEQDKAGKEEKEAPEPPPGDKKGPPGKKG
jgi:hypothetical protein